MSDELSLREAIFTTRAMRRLKPDPVAREDLEFIVEAATMASSGGNRQEWAFVVATDAAVRARLGEIYADVGNELIRDTILANPEIDDASRRVYRGAMRLVDHMGEAPAIIVPVMIRRAPETSAQGASYWGSIFPAIQNLLLAARSRGLGATLTTIHKFREEQVREALGLPEESETIAMIPVGYPRGKWGRPLRAPASELTHWDRWGG